METSDSSWNTESPRMAASHILSLNSATILGQVILPEFSVLKHGPLALKSDSDTVNELVWVLTGHMSSLKGPLVSHSSSHSSSSSA